MCHGVDPTARAGASAAVGGCDLGALPCQTPKTPHPSLTVTPRSERHCPSHYPFLCRQAGVALT